MIEIHASALEKGDQFISVRGEPLTVTYVGTGIIFANNPLGEERIMGVNANTKVKLVSFAPEEVMV